MKFIEALNVIHKDRSIKMFFEESICFRFLDEKLVYYVPNYGMRPLFKGLDFEAINSTDWKVEKIKDGEIV